MEIDVTTILTARWPRLKELSLCVDSFSNVDMWLFGSMLHSDSPRDLDVLLVYKHMNDIDSLKSISVWELSVPAVDIIAMTTAEVLHYRFIEMTGAVPVQSSNDR